MEPRAYLTELGYSAEDITAMLADEKQAKLIAAAAKSFGEGRTYKQQADAEKAETAQFWEQKTQELQNGVNRLTAAEKRAAQAESEAARVRAYNKSLADAGYDIPKEMYEGGGVHTPEPPKYITQAELDRAARSTAPDLVQLQALSNEYQHLFGEPYVDIHADFVEAQAAGKPLTEYARTKRGFEAKKAEKAQAADQARIDKLVAERLAPKEAELAAKYGSNGELASPRPTKFDRIAKAPGFKEDSWKSREGRNANRTERLKRFENVSIQ